MADARDDLLAQQIDPYEELGATGLKRFAGRIYEEWLPELSGEKWRRVLKEMLTQDPVFGAVILAVKMLMRQVDWAWVPADGDESDEYAEHFETCREDMSHTWEDFLSEVMSFPWWGWAYFETVYKKRKGPDQSDPSMRSKFKDGKVGWRKIAIRAQDTLMRWEFDDDGGIRGMWQMAPPYYIPTYLPIEKCLLFRTEAQKNNPEGVSVLRNAYRPWYFKKRIENLEGIGVERDLAGLPVIYAPPDIMAPDAPPTKAALFERLKQIVTNIRRDEQEGLVMPLAYDPDTKQPIYKLELLTTGGERQFATSEIVQRLKQEQAMIALADFILLGHEAVGSFALASSKTTLFAVALGAWLDALCAVMNNHAAPRLMKLNGWNVSRTPKLTHGDIKSVDLTELGTYIRNLSQSGMPLFPNPGLERYVLEQAHLPIPEDSGIDTASLHPAAPPGAPGGGGMGGPPGPPTSPTDPGSSASQGASAAPGSTPALSAPPPSLGASPNAGAFASEPVSPSTAGRTGF